MNSHDQFDRTDAELEALLGATFASEAEAKVPDARPVPPFPATTRLATVHPIRRRWVGLSVVAASLVAVAVAATVIGSEAMTSQKAPVPAGTSVAPPPTVATSPAVPTANLTTAAASTSPPSSPPAPTTKQLTAHGVTVTVPTSWGVQPLQDGPDYGMSRSCIAVNPSTTPIEYEARRCALVVLVTDDFPNNPIDATGYDVALSKSCGEANAELTPLTDDTVTIDDQSAEHRTWSTSCLPSFSAETWTVSTWPQVQFIRLGDAADTTTVATVDTAVTGAALPDPISSMRGSDTGYATALTGDVLLVDRITLVGPRVVNDNPKTYEYPIADDATIVCATTSNPAMADMTLDQLRVELSGGTVPGFLPLDQLYVFVQTDGQHATFVALRPRSQLA